MYILEQLASVDWPGTLDTEGLEGDWHGLYLAWFFETSPSGIGEWGYDEDGIPLVTITSEGYVHDLRAKPHYQETIDRFKEQFPDIGKIHVGDRISNPFYFTGPGSASGDYNALEWFMGSYRTEMIVQCVDLDERKVYVKVIVSNTSHWESGTRLPQSFIDRGLPPYLIQDAPREAPGPGGTFNQKFIWEDSIQY